jgi:hypothetical protein
MKQIDLFSMKLCFWQTNTKQRRCPQEVKETKKIV